MEGDGKGSWGEDQTPQLPALDMIPNWIILLHKNTMFHSNSSFQTYSVSLSVIGACIHYTGAATSGNKLRRNQWKMAGVEEKIRKERKMKNRRWRRKRKEGEESVENKADEKVKENTEDKVKTGVIFLLNLYPFLPLPTLSRPSPSLLPFTPPPDTLLWTFASLLTHCLFLLPLTSCPYSTSFTLSIQKEDNMTFSCSLVTRGRHSRYMLWLRW